MKFDPDSSVSNNGDTNTIARQDKPSILQPERRVSNELSEQTLHIQSKGIQEADEGYDPGPSARLSEPNATESANADSHNVSQPKFPESVPVSIPKLSLALRVIFSIKFKEEKEHAKSQRMIRNSIGNQIIDLLKQSAKKTKDRVKEANFLKARRICEKFRKVQRGLSNSNDAQRKQRRDILEELHHVDINPNKLAIEWLGSYTREWLEYIGKRWTEKEKEIVAAKSKRLTRERPP